MDWMMALTVSSRPNPTHSHTSARAPRQRARRATSATAALALVALVALRARWRGALALVWLCVGFGLLDTVNAIIQSMRDNVFSYPLGFNWIIVAIYVPPLLLSSL